MKRRLFSITALVLCTMLGASAARAAPRSSLVGGAAASRVTASPDFNGDGFPDIAIGVPHDPTEQATDSGAVNVLYGGPNGLQVNGPVDQRWSQGANQVKGTAETGDMFGAALANGDFNGDGFSDLAVGAPDDNASDQSHAGVVNVLYGSVDGLQALLPDDQLWTQDATDVQDTAEPDDNFGSALAAGDFNGDGFADLAIGVPGESVGTIGSAGAVAVLYGSAAGLQATAPDDQFWSQDTASVRDLAEAGDAFGSALAAGDFDGNGKADLAIGVPGENVGTIADAGAVAVLYGQSGGLQADLPNDNYWNQNSIGIRDLSEKGDAFGASLAAGDFDGNGKADLAIGIPGEDAGTIVDAGAVGVLYGATGGLQTDAPDDDYWNQNSTGVLDLSETGDSFGASLASGNFNSDAFADLAIGVPGEDVGTVADAGSVAVLFGVTGGLQANSPDDNFWNQESTGVKGTSETGDLFGTSVAAADFDANGFPDLAIGMPGEPAGGLAGAGGISVLYATANGLQADSPDDDRWTQDSPGVEGVAEVGDAFGSSLTAAG